MSLDPAAAAELGTVRIVGTGLLGASIGLGLRGLGVRVLLHDPSPTALALARDVGAGEPDPGDEPVSLVVVGAPPDVTAEVVRAELAAHPQATVTDVASVKGQIAAVMPGIPGAERYVGGHPMAGRERSGPTAARADLFLGRPWVVCPSPSSPERHHPRNETVRMLALALGAMPVFMPAGEHDEAVALVSHVPQLAASLVASRLVRAADPAVGLAGQGLRDVTRIADSDPVLWAQILSANAAPVVNVLKDLRVDLDHLIVALDALRHDEAVGARAAVAQVIHNGREGRERIPGKHGDPQTRYAVVTALLPDSPGELARLFDDIGEAGVNVEEFSLEHSPGARVGLGSVSVLPAARDVLEAALTAKGWHVVS
ncbi:prephenate dehydrogenase [Kineosporia sp. J2-2]|uniref:Prephenate dehydrogenase n=1 Tax=Kineosporia corallincola TaxID=2835133 RepID=A0ABS5TN64_9ACTN|nr:prephenate dehydrogenase [Kineosporia corallincola]MBT0772536.1 prephenate dehydrogenase [Kineosporia corallincola]